VSDPARRRGPVALLQRAVLGALITTTVAIVERRLRKALERRPL
jgi:hypothetical protein